MPNTCSEGVMDKEEKENTIGNESSMDADELLKDLEEDEDEEEYSESSGAVGAPSLARMIAVSADSLAGMQTVRDLQPESES